MKVSKIYGFRVKPLQFYRWILNHPNSELCKLTIDYFGNYEGLQLADLIEYMETRSKRPELIEGNNDPEDAIEELKWEFRWHKFKGFSVFFLDKNVCEDQDFIIGHLIETTDFKYYFADPKTGTPVGKVTVNDNSELQDFISNEVSMMSEVYDHYWVSEE
jgi:hypothetical protein